MVFSYCYVNTNPSWSLRLSCQFFTYRCVSLRDDPIILPIRKINSKFSQWCLFRSSQVVFVFPHPPTLFFKDSLILIKYPFIHGKSLHSFRSMFWSGDPSWRCSRASSSSLFFLVFFSGVGISSFQCWSYPFLLLNALSCWKFLSKALLLIHLTLVISSAL